MHKKEKKKKKTYLEEETSVSNINWYSTWNYKSVPFHFKIFFLIIIKGPWPAYISAIEHPKSAQSYWFWYDFVLLGPGVKLKPKSE